MRGRPCCREREAARTAAIKYFQAPWFIDFVICVCENPPQ